MHKPVYIHSRSLYLSSASLHEYEYRNPKRVSPKGHFKNTNPKSPLFREYETSLGGLLKPGVVYPNLFVYSQDLQTKYPPCRVIPIQFGAVWDDALCVCNAGFHAKCVWGALAAWRTCFFNGAER